MTVNHRDGVRPDFLIADIVSARTCVGQHGFMDKKIEASNRNKVLRRVAKHLRPHCFDRTKTTFFTEPHEHVIQFIHIHKFTFSPSFRVHVGIRVLNDLFPAAALNGPDSDAYTRPNSPNGKKYNLRFHKTDESVESCAENIVEWWVEVGVPWFEQFSSTDALLNAPNSPLQDESQARLREALEGNVDSAAIERSLAIFGVAQQGTAAERSHLRR